MQHLGAIFKETLFLSVVKYAQPAQPCTTLTANASLNSSTSVNVYLQKQMGPVSASATATVPYHVI